MKDPMEQQLVYEYGDIRTIDGEWLSDKEGLFPGEYLKRWVQDHNFALMRDEMVHVILKYKEIIADMSYCIPLAKPTMVSNLLARIKALDEVQP